MPRSRRLFSRSFWTEEVSCQNADFLLLLVSVGVGIIDASTFPDLRVFAANMTGNTIFLALRASRVPDEILSASRSSVALVAFWAGSFTSGQAGHIIGPRRRWWIATTFLIQGLLVLAAAIAVWSGGISEQDIRELNNKVLGLVTLLAFAYGAQGTTARGLQVPEIPTVVVTSAMVDLFGDKNLFARHNRPRNRRIGFIIALFIGGFIGGWTYQRVNSALVIALAATVKLMCVPLLIFFDSKEDEQRRKREREEIKQQGKIDA